MVKFVIGVVVVVSIDTTGGWQAVSCVVVRNLIRSIYYRILIVLQPESIRLVIL